MLLREDNKMIDDPSIDNRAKLRILGERLNRIDNKICNTEQEKIKRKKEMERLQHLYKEIVTKITDTPGETTPDDWKSSCNNTSQDGYNSRYTANTDNENMMNNQDIMNNMQEKIII